MFLKEYGIRKKKRKETKKKSKLNTDPHLFATHTGSCANLRKKYSNFKHLHSLLKSITQW